MVKFFDESKLKPGTFYWVIPAYDADSELTFEEQRKPEPARYIGECEAGQNWDMLGTEEWTISAVICECLPPKQDDKIIGDTGN